MSEKNYFGTFAAIPWETPDPNDVDCVRLINLYRTPGIEISQSAGISEILTSISFPSSIVSKIASSNASDIYLSLAYHKNTDLGATRKGYTLIVFEMSNGKIQLDEDSILWDALIQGNPNDHRNISLENAKAIIREYRTNQPVPINQNSQRILKGHTFRQNEWNQVYSRVSELLEAQLILAYHDHQTSANQNSGYTWILLGSNYGGANTSAGSPIFDFCDPCPKKCPDNVDFPYF